MALLHRRQSTGPPPPRPEAVIVVTGMRRRHVREVIAIENTIFPRPWSAALYLSELAYGPSRHYYVAIVDGAVVGYTGCMVVEDEAHITTVGVAPSWQRHRVASRLLYRLASDVRDEGVRSLTLEVRMTNHGAQELYRRFGFTPAGIRKNYYAEVNEDGLVMWAHGVESEEYGERLATIGQELAAAPAAGAPGSRHEERA
jgi:ribosomal-protein-alanine N-acetyltransferase